MRFRLRVVPHRAPFFLSHFVYGCCYFTLLLCLFVSPCCHGLLCHLVIMPYYFTLLHCLVTLTCITFLPCFVVLLFGLPYCVLLLFHLATSPCCIALLIHLTRSPFCSSLNTFLVFINHKLPIY